MNYKLTLEFPHTDQQEHLVEVVSMPSVEIPEIGPNEQGEKFLDFANAKQLPLITKFSEIPDFLQPYWQSLWKECPKW